MLVLFCLSPALQLTRVARPEDFAGIDETYDEVWLEADVNFHGRAFPALRTFSGEFRGQNHTVRGVRADGPLVGQCINCYFRDLRFVDVQVNSPEGGAALFGQVQNLTLENVQVNVSAFSGGEGAAALALFSFGQLVVNNSVFRDVSVHCFRQGNSSALVNVITGNVLVNNSLVRAVLTADAGLFFRTSQARLQNSEIELFWSARSGTS